MEIDKELLKRLSKLELLGIIEYGVYSSTRDINGSASDISGCKLSIECTQEIKVLNLSSKNHFTDLEIRFADGCNGVELILPKSVNYLKINAYNVLFESIEGLENVRHLKGKFDGCGFESDIVFDSIEIAYGTFSYCTFLGRVEFRNVTCYNRRETRGNVREAGCYSRFIDCTYCEEVYIRSGNWIKDLGLRECDKVKLYIDDVIEGYIPYIEGREVNIVGNKDGILQLGGDEHYYGSSEVNIGGLENLSYTKGIRQLVIGSNAFMAKTQEGVGERVTEMDLEIVEIHITGCPRMLVFPSLVGYNKRGGGKFRRCRNLKKVVFIYTGHDGVEYDFEVFADCILFMHLVGREEIREYSIKGGDYKSTYVTKGSITRLFSDFRWEDIEIEIEFKGERRSMGTEYRQKFFC